MKVRHSAAVAGVAAFALLLGACGGGDGGSSSQAPTEDGLKGAATEFADITVAGDWNKAYDFMTEECQGSKTRAEFIAETGVAMEMAKAFGLDFSELEITDIQVRNVADDRGEVLTVAELDGSPMDDEPTWNEWVYEDGRWRNVECGVDDSDDDSSGDDDSGGSTDTTIGGDLRPSGEAQAEKELDAATSAELGETVELGDGISVTVSDISIGQAYGDPAVAVTLRVENRGEDAQNPDVGVRCAGSTDDGMATSDESTYETWADLPSGSYAEGVVNVVPESGQTCEGPAYVWITPFFSLDDTAVKVPIDPSVLAQLNS
jgi:hypothetical protein